MIKLVYVIAKRADLSDAEYYDYWLNTHGPKVAGVARTIRATKYVQSHTIDTPFNEALRAPRGMLPPVAGITEVWWDSVEDFQAGSATPEGQEAARMLAEDEAKFIDFAGSQIYLTQEHVIYDHTGGRPLGSDAVKCAYVLARRPDLTPEQCHRTWKVDHGPLVASFAEVTGGRKYIQSHTIHPELNAQFKAGRGLADPVDGLTEVWLDSIDVLGTGGEAGAKAGQAMMEDEMRFVEMGRSRCFFTKEHVIFDHQKAAA
ncbi:EthD domain-containing protein [Zavarzinia sp. CC-PAN008]|uniref:EthD domain-containing protein n=1 Tax=Zavarzinia sp. CC-PAN008 TaxID=3243332 RepID=UPI003F745CA3